MEQNDELSTSELVKLRTETGAKIIDVRPVDAYNGWRMKNEERGGHIAGAKSLPLKWTNYIDWQEILKTKNILPDQKIVIYGYTSEDSRKVADLLKKAGFDDISVYNNFVDEWAADSELPMRKLERHNQLVPASWVKDIVDGNTPADHPGGKTVICQAHYGHKHAYLSGHIPGAIDINTLSLESTETWNRRSPEELKLALEKHGITADTTVVLYGKFMWPDNRDEYPGSAAGHLGAIRCAFIMMYAGVKDVRVLNAGFQAWEDAGYEIHYDDVPKQPVSDFGGTIPANPHLAVDISGAKEMLESNDAELVSVRSWPEFIGEVSGYNYIEKKGRIPGAVFGNCGSDAYHMENYRNPDHTTREFQEIEALWYKAGLTPEKHLAFYCGTGWRGSEAFFNAWLMGWPNVSVFDGGWFEWSSDPNNPWETGVPS